MKHDFIRISQGKLKGLKIPFSRKKNKIWNATPQKLKEALFQIIQNHIQHPQKTLFLDLYTGSGQIALEAFSRNMKIVFALDIDPERVQNIRKIIENLPTQEGFILRKMKAERFLVKENISINIFSDEIKNIVLFADPPYSFSEQNFIYHQKIFQMSLEFAKNHPGYSIYFFMQIPYGKNEYKSLTEFGNQFPGKLYIYGKNAIVVKKII